MRLGHLLAAVLFLIFLGTLGYALMTQPGRSRIDVTAPPQFNAQSPRENTGSANPPTANVPSGYYTQPTAAEFTVTYTDQGFNPSTLTVSVGTLVHFQNKSSKVFWPASAGHPDHALYPVPGGCIGSLFDACAAVPQGTSWSFRFDARGSWPYHDHLSPGHTGLVVVL